MSFLLQILKPFQHTAARRRLLRKKFYSIIKKAVSTHSRAEAAATKEIPKRVDTNVSTHSRAEAAANL